MRFQEKLFIKIRRFLTIMFLTLSIIFIVLYLFLNFFDREHVARIRMDKIEENIDELIDLFDKRLSSLSLNDIYTDIFKDDELGSYEVELDNYNFSRKLDYKVHFNLVDLDYNILYQTDKSKSGYIDPYRSIIKDRVLDTGQSGMLTYRPANQVPAVVFYGPIYDDTELLGIAIYYINTNDLSYYLLSNQGDYVVTDRFGNVVVTSHKTFINRYDKFEPVGKKLKVNDNNYKIYSRNLSDYNIYYLADLNVELGLYLIISLFILFGSLGIVYFFSNKFMHELISNNSKEINKIIEDTNVVSNGDLEHKIDTNLDDEFGNLASNINKMIDRLNEELKKNQELNEINLIYERKKLDAQFNPHLLYNSLETIRYSMKFDQEGTEKFILNLTDILRYSIDNSIDKVKLKDDISYIKKYIDLHHYRLGNKFTWNFEIDDEVLDYEIPKLTLQPLIENSLKYGFKNQNSLHIDIIGKKEQNKLILKVKDNGSNLDKEYVDEINTLLNSNENNTKHIGLHNIRRRISIMYEKSKMYIESNDGTCVTIEIEVN